MSAEIIQFGKPQPATRPGTRNQVYESALDTAIGKRRSVSRRRKKETVRVMFDGDLYQVDFYGDDVEKVYAIQYRISAGGVQELKRRHWNPGEYSPRNLDPALVKAARKARGSGRSDVDFAVREAALAQLHKRHTKLVSEVAKIEATIASMQQRKSS